MALPVLSTYRLQLRGDVQRIRVHLRRRREPAGLPRRPRGVASVPVADHDRGRRVQPRLRRHRPDDGVARARRGRRVWRGCRRRPARAAWAWSSTSCPITSGSTSPSRTRGGGMCCGTAGPRPTRTYFDIDWDLDEDGRIVLPILGSDDDVADLKVDGDLLRLGDLALPIAPRHRRKAPARRSTTASTTGSWAGGTACAAIGASSRSPRWPACVRRTARCSTPATPRSPGGSPRDLVDGVRIDHPDGLSDPCGYLALAA